MTQVIECDAVIGSRALVGGVGYRKLILLPDIPEPSRLVSESVPAATMIAVP